jgi:uncharacterized Fe-S cluster-containing radical SAM superfamily protein
LDEVARKPVGIARKKGYHQVRISVSEPTISKDHLLRVIDLIPNDIHFILETKGILIGRTTRIMPGNLRGIGICT